MCMLNTVVNPMLNTLGGGGKKGNQLIQFGGSLDGGHEFTLTIDQADYSVPASMDHAWAELPAYVEVPDYRYVTHPLRVNIFV